MPHLSEITRVTVDYDELVSNLSLYFDAGAMVKFPAQRLPFTQGRQQSIEALTPVPLIGGRNLENVTVGGRGE